MAINNEQQIQEFFKECCNTYLVDKDDYNASEKRQLLNYKSFGIITKDIPALLSAITKGSQNQYIFKGSVGNAEIATVPWIGIFDKEITDTAQKGFYIVFLFKANMSGVYLSLNQGFTEFENKYKVKVGMERIKVNAQRLQNIIRNLGTFDKTPIDLETKRKLGKGYEAGNICSKYYPINKLIGDEQIIQDFKELLTIYNAVKKQVFDVNGILQPNEEEFQEEIQDAEGIYLPPGPILKRAKRTNSISSSWTRDPDIAFLALENANFKCENDVEHTTFISGKNKHPFMEAHHLIPMEFHDEFPDEIDVPENIICLCPTCHRKFHNAETAEKEKLINKFYPLRKDQLITRNIIIKKEKLQAFYKCANYISD